MIAKLLLLCLGLVVPALAVNVPFIIGGTIVSSATKWPWQCSMLVNGYHKCGASIISSTWLVTAAHCVQYPLNSYVIKCGSVHYADGLMRTIKRKIPHEKYNIGNGTFPNDIAVIELTSALPISDTIRSILMTSTDVAGNTDCYITGWGDTTSGPTPVLKQAKINVYTNAVCKNTWGSNINDGQICIGDTVNERGSCHGDDGGPLVCRVDGDYQLVGAMSWMEGRCFTIYPSVYSRITYFRQWIRDNSGV